MRAALRKASAVETTFSSLWEISRTVFVFAISRITSMMSFSLSTSMFEVTSSKIYTGVSCKSARAIARR